VHRIVAVFAKEIQEIKQLNPELSELRVFVFNMHLVQKNKKQRNQPNATSSTIIREKPMAKAMAPIFECCPWLISGISSSTTTYSMVPAANP
jgi:hypothetical protein